MEEGVGGRQRGKGKGGEERREGERMRRRGEKGSEHHKTPQKTTPPQKVSQKTLEKSV